MAALRAVGLGEADAKTTAEVLVTTDEMGVFSHGTNSCPARWNGRGRKPRSKKV